MHRAGGYLLSERIAPLWIGEFGIGTRSLAGFSGVWWNNFEAWLTENDVDWCWWALNPTQPRGTVPVAGRHRSRLGRREAVRPARPGLARCRESAGAGHPQDDDPAPHRSRRCTLPEGSHVCLIRAATGPAPVAATEDKSGTALAWAASSSS